MELLHVLVTMLYALHMLFYLSPPRLLGRNYYYYSFFTNNENEAGKMK